MQAIAALGLTDRTGKSPVPETARKTWLQVRMDVAKGKADDTKRTPSLALDEIAPGVRAVEMPATLDHTEQPPIQLDVRPARPLLMTVAAPPQPAEAPLSNSAPPRLAEGGDDAEAQIRSLLEDAAAGKVPAPRPIADR